MELFEATLRGDVSEIERLCASLPRPLPLAADGRTALTVALVDAHNFAAADALLSSSSSSYAAMIDERDGLCWTSLHHAAMRGDADATAWLLSRGADANATDSTGSVPLHCAAHSGSVAVAQLLLRAGARSDCVCLRGWSPAHYASMQGNEDFVAWWLNATSSSSAAQQQQRNDEGMLPADVAATPAIACEFEAADLAMALSGVHV